MSNLTFQASNNRLIIDTSHGRLICERKCNCSLSTPASVVFKPSPDHRDSTFQHVLCLSCWKKFQILEWSWTIPHLQREGLLHFELKEPVSLPYVVELDCSCTENLNVFVERPFKTPWPKEVSLRCACSRRYRAALFMDTKMVKMKRLCDCPKEVWMNGCKCGGS